MSEVALLEKSAVHKTNPERRYYQAIGTTRTEHQNMRAASVHIFQQI